MASKLSCPHCGNRDPQTLQDNGEDFSSADLTLLCVARVKPDATTFLEVDRDAQGLVACGMQWDPNA